MYNTVSSAVSHNFVGTANPNSNPNPISEYPILSPLKQHILYGIYLHCKLNKIKIYFVFELFHHTSNKTQKWDWGLLYKQLFSLKIHLFISTRCIGSINKYWVTAYMHFHLYVPTLNITYSPVFSHCFHNCIYK